MASSNDTDQASPPPDKERRANTRLREVFESACRVTAPFFDIQQGFGGSPMSLSAHRALRENFPDLPRQDVAILLSAVRAFHKTRAGKGEQPGS